ncbi:unknown protein (plasmid) [Calothrix sp. PCC 7716]|nr:unknown protein [Calothrix sp. PCC 7716]
MIYKHRNIKILILLKLVILKLIFTVNPVGAQQIPVPDNTLGNENSEVIPFGLIDIVTGGATRGSNLFHSFKEFNVGVGRGVYFFSPNANIQHILARVTGGNKSEILGVLGTRTFDGSNISASNANLFLINPNGIVFGENARLDIGGSFVATTANALQFGEQGVFSATSPQVPRLLNVNPSAFLFNQIAAQAIINQSRVPNTINPSFFDGLRVSNGKNLLLIGGDISLNGGILSASGGKIKLGGLAAPGTINLNVDGHNFNVSFPENIAKADVSLNNRAAINVSGERAGNISIEAGNVSFSGVSQINSATGNEDSGDIFIRAEKLELSGNSSISSMTTGSGQSGNIRINTDIFTVREDSSVLTSSLLTSGKAGEISLQAKNSVNIFDNSALSTVAIGTGNGTTTGSGGNISIETKDLNIQNSNLLVSTFLGQGNAGDLKIKATNSVNSNNSIIATSSLGGGTGGSTLIETKNLSLQNGASITTIVLNPNTVDLNAILDPQVYSADGISFFNALISTIKPQNVGNANSGDLTIIASDSIRISGESKNGISSFLSTDTSGTGNAGNIKIETGKLSIQDGGYIFAGTRPNSQGKGGNLSVTARDSIELIGTSKNEIFFSGLFAYTRGSGDAGEIQVTTDKLIVSDGAKISADTFNQGKGGSLTVTASDFVEIRGASKNNLLLSNLSTNTFASGNAGSLKIDTGRLILQDGGYISASTGLNSQGRGGNLTVNARNSVEIIGVSTNKESTSGLFAGTEGTGDAGNLKIETSKLYIQDRARISASNVNQGNAGKIDILTNSLVLTNGAEILNETSGNGNAGDININTELLSMNNISSIFTFTRGEGNAGLITINARDIQMNNFSFMNSGIRAGGIGKGADINIQTNSLSLFNGSQISSSIFRQEVDDQGNIIPAGNGNAGNLKITASDSITLAGMGDNAFKSAFFTSAERGTTGAAGDIFVETANLQIKDGSIIGASTSNASNGGDIFINTKNFEALNGGQVVSATRSSGNAGTINFINPIGNITISGVDPNFQRELDQAMMFISNTPIARFDEVSDIINNEAAASGIFANTALNSTGNGGIINLQGNSISLNNKAQISAQSRGTGKAGDININASQGFNLNNGQIITTAQQADGGNINITSENIRLRNNSDIRTDLSRGQGSGGNITLTANSIIAAEDSDIFAFAPEGQGGNIIFNTRAFFSNPPYRPTPSTTDATTLNNLNGNNRVDVNASGRVSGSIIGIPETTFIQNSLADLPNNQIDTNALIANSCIARTANQNSTFFVVGKGGIPLRPDSASLPNYSTGAIRSLETASRRQPWKSGDAVVEPTGAYELPNGKLILSRECN